MILKDRKKVENEQIELCVIKRTLVKDAIIKQNDKCSDYVLFTLSVPQIGTRWYDYINCIAFNENAAIIAKSPLKGTPYHIEGRIHTSSFDKNGKKHYLTQLLLKRSRQ